MLPGIGAKPNIEKLSSLGSGSKKATINDRKELYMQLIIDNG